MKRAILRACHQVVRTKVQKSAPWMELFSVLFRDQDEKLGDSRHKSRFFLCVFLQSEICITKAVGQFGVGWVGDVGCLGFPIEKDSQSARSLLCGEGRRPDFSAVPKSRVVG